MILPGRLRLRRLPARGRARALLAGHGEPSRSSPTAAARCSGSATASRCCSRRACCPERCWSTGTSATSAATSTCGSRTTRHAVHAPSTSGQRRHGCRSATARATTPRRPDAARASSARAASSSATATPDGGVTDAANPNGAATQHRRHLQRAGQRRRPDAAPGPLLARACSATTTAGSLFESCSAERGPAARRRRPADRDDPITPELVSEHNLSEDEYQRILEILGREPNLVELGIFSAMWSEHCSLQVVARSPEERSRRRGRASSRGRARTPASSTSATGSRVAFKMESHNHPSFIEPYQGAATGVGGILRDVFTMGARPIASLNSLRFGPLDAPRHAAPRRRRRARDRRLRQLHRHPDGRRRDDVPPGATTATSSSTS